MPYARVVFERNTTNDTYAHIGYELHRIFEVVWREYKDNNAKAQDYWMKVEDPSGKLNDLATQVIAKAKTALAATTLTHAVGNQRAWFYVKEGFKQTPVGSLLYGARAFPTVTLPALGAQAVVQRRDNNKEYVFDDYKQLTPRYVYRFITATDLAYLEQGEGLKPRSAAANDTVYMHVAGKGHTRFISTTRSKQPIQNAHGEVFGTRRVKIDLSLVPRENIYDMSTPQGEIELLRQKQGTQGQPETYTSQVQQALKDAKRTKEVLIGDGIPRAAIVETAGFTLPDITRVNPQQQ